LRCIQKAKLALTAGKVGKVSHRETRGTDKQPVAELAITGRGRVLVVEPESSVPKLVAQRAPVAV
jgi:hypothetical protein